MSALDLTSVDWTRIALPVAALRPALAPTRTAQGEVGILCTDSTLDWATAEPTGWVTFAGAKAIIPDPARSPNSFNPHPGWAMMLGPARSGQLSDGRDIVVMPLTCGPTDGNGQNMMVVVFDGNSGTAHRPNLIGIYQPPGMLKPNALSVAGGHIVVGWSILEPSDPHCCPSGSASGTIDVHAGRLVPSWPDNGALRAVLWQVSLGPAGDTTSSPATGSTSSATASGPALDLTRVNWQSFSLPLEPLIAAFIKPGFAGSASAWRKDFPDGRVPFRYQQVVAGRDFSPAVEAFIPDPSVFVPPGVPGKAGYLLIMRSGPALGELTDGPAVAVFDMEFTVAVPADGSPHVLLVVDGAGGAPNALGIFQGGQFIRGIAVKGGTVTATVGDAQPWEGAMTVRYQAGRLVPSLQPANSRWGGLTLWTRPTG